MKDPWKGQQDIPYSTCPLQVLHDNVSWYNVSRIPVQLLTVCILTLAVGVVSPVSAGTLAGPYNNLCAWALAKNL